MHLPPPLLPLGLVSWNRVLPSCVYVSSELSGRLWFAGDGSDIPVRLLVQWLGSSTTAREPRHRVSTSSGRLVDPRDPYRWAPRFLLGSGRARARPQPVPMTLLRPALLPLPRQRSTSSGDPAAARLPVVSSVVCRALHNCRYLVIPYVRRSTWAHLYRNDGRFERERL